ncbi:DMT family transporter [Bacillus subtilis]|uniref:DMT family transporter n=1 Tax=Bacillus sp. 7705b TaxID=2028568 RepID=UPI000BAE5AA4|nr:DMT family transporter [Bacillus sp. 7705b]PAY13823.1 EamA family transporter [Bacillus sp. 7705b]WEY91255.1 DMT family transporter [Bacillus subtilis]WGD89832.1 DMT family transporter [Bacillus subtilis]
MNQKRLLLYGLVFFVTAIWGLNLVIIKVLVEDLPPQTMTAFRIMMAGITALIIIVLGKSFRRLTKKEWIYTLLGMLFGVILHHSLIAVGLTMIDASNASLILALVPLTTAILAVLFLGEQLTKLRVLGFILALTGVFFIQGRSFSNMQLSQGELILIIAMFVQAISFIFVKKATETLDSKQVTTIMYLAGSIGLLIISFITEPGGVNEMTSAPLFTYFLFIVSGLVATGIGYIVFNAAIQQIGAGQTAIFNNFVPFFGLVFSAIFLNETITISQLIGFVFIVAGVLFGTGYIGRLWAKKHRQINNTKKSVG